MRNGLLLWITATGLFALSAAATPRASAASPEIEKTVIPGEPDSQPSDDSGLLRYNTAAELPTFYQRLSAGLDYPLSFTNGKHRDFGQWKREARQKILDCLLRPPPAVPFEPKVLGEKDHGSYITRRIAFNISGFNRIEAFLLVPKGKGPRPGMLVLHDHGAEFRWGRAKVARTALADHPDLKKWVATYYGGRFLADELAKRGYVCLAYDMFYWGDRGRKEGAKEAYQAQQAVVSPPFAPV